MWVFVLKYLGIQSLNPTRISLGVVGKFHNIRGNQLQVLMQENHPKCLQPAMRAGDNLKVIENINYIK